MAQGIWHSEDKPLKTLGTDGGKAAIEGKKASRCGDSQPIALSICWFNNFLAVDTLLVIIHIGREAATCPRINVEDERDD